AHGGALYLADRSGTKLMPTFISKGCPPLIEVPDPVLQQAAAMPIELDNYLRSHSIEAGDGLVGRVWKDGEAILLADLADAPELSKLRTTALGAASVMV